MKHLSFISLALCLFLACNTPANNGIATANNTATKDTAVAYAYPVTYFSEYDKADPKYAQIILDIWKDYDNNTFANHRDAFADTVAMDFSNGSTFTGSKDSLLAMMNKYRSQHDAASSTVQVVETVKPKGKDETWVSVWGTEYDTDKGKKDSVHLNENWMFNKDGKIAYMTLLAQKPHVGK